MRVLALDGWQYGSAFEWLGLFYWAVLATFVLAPLALFGGLIWLDVRAGRRAADRARPPHRAAPVTPPARSTPPSAP